MAAPGTRARMAESKTLWIATEYSIKEGLTDLECLAATVTRETTECSRILREAIDPSEDESWHIVVMLENLRTSRDTF